MFPDWNRQIYLLHMSDANKPKNCTYCEKEFPHYVNMIRHRKLAHAERYKVENCPQARHRARGSDRRPHRWASNEL